MKNEILRSICAYIIWSFLAATLLHGASHLFAGAPLTPLPPSLFAVGISVEPFFSLGPLVALALLYTRWFQWGMVLLVLTMLIALLWGFGGHFLSSGGDNVMAHPTSPAAPAFLLTSILVFIIPWAGATTGIYALIQIFHQPGVPNTVGTRDKSGR